MNLIYDILKISILHIVIHFYIITYCKLIVLKRTHIFYNILQNI